MRKIRSVDLILENCDSITVPMNMIHFISFNITHRDYFSINIDHLHISTCADYFHIVIKNLDTFKYTGMSDKEESALERLKIPDITGVEIQCEDSNEGWENIPEEGDCNKLKFIVPYKTCGLKYCNSLYQSIKKKNDKDYDGNSLWSIMIKKRLHWPIFMYKICYWFQRMARIITDKKYRDYWRTYGS